MVSNDSGLCMEIMVLSLSTQGTTILSVRIGYAGNDDL